MTGQGVGASVRRKEDDRFLQGRGQFIADIRLAGMKDVAFVRSPLAHAKILGVTIPEEDRPSVFEASDLGGVKPIRANSGFRGSRSQTSRCLRTGKVRYVGELVAMCVAPTRAEAEDIAGSASRIDLEELPAVHDMLEARRAGPAAGARALGRQRLSRNQFRRRRHRRGQGAPIKVTREIRTARQCMRPLEGRGVVATWQSRLGQLTLYTSTQMPHIVRSGLAECLGHRRRARSAWSRPMSAAASATRAFCCRRRSPCLADDALAAIRCAGSRTAAST